MPRWARSLRDLTFRAWFRVGQRFQPGNAKGREGSGRKNWTASEIESLIAL